MTRTELTEQLAEVLVDTIAGIFKVEPSKAMKQKAIGAVITAFILRDRGLALIDALGEPS